MASGWLSECKIIHDVMPEYHHTWELCLWYEQYEGSGECYKDKKKLAMEISSNKCKKLSL